MAIRRYGKKGARCQGRYHKGKGFVVYGALAFSYGYCTAFTSQKFKHQHPNSPGPLKKPPLPRLHSIIPNPPTHRLPHRPKRNPPAPFFPLLPLLTLPSTPPSIPLSPYPAPSHRQTLSRPPATNSKASHRGILTSVPSKSGSQLIPSVLETQQDIRMALTRWQRKKIGQKR